MKLFTFTKLFLINIFDFKGRASRWEYWGGSLGSFLIAFVSGFFLFYLPEFFILILILYLGFAQFSCGIRRLHDVGKSGWTLLWAIVPFGFLYLLYLDVQPSEQKNNQWGETPIHTRSEATPEISSEVFKNEIIDEGEDTPY